MRAMRFFKQLEFLCEDGTRSRVGEILAASAPNLTSSSEKPIHLRGRDRALESQACELLRSLGARKLAREVRVEWNPRMRTCAGRTDYREKLILLNPLLFDLGDQLASKEHAIKNLECNMHSRFIDLACGERVPSKPECKVHSSLARDVAGVSRDRAPRRGIVCDEVDRTLRHELAHLLAQWRVGRRRIAPHGKEWRQACRD